MNNTFEFIFVVLVIALFYWFVAWSIIKSILRILKGRDRFFKTIPFVLAAATFFGTTIWGIVAIIHGDGYYDNPVAPFPPIALLSSVFAIGVWLLATAIILTFNWLFSIWMKAKAG